jgi:DNA-binding beta-propeller fold protein YncE
MSLACLVSVAWALPTDVDGPHGVAVAPDAKHYIVSIGHGAPYGSHWKYTTGDDQLGRRVELGLFPATVAVSPDDRYAFLSVEGVGAEPGTVEVIDLGTLATVGTVHVGSMAAGLDVWKAE